MHNLTTYVANRCLVTLFTVRNLKKLFKRPRLRLSVVYFSRLCFEVCLAQTNTLMDQLTKHSSRTAFQVNKERATMSKVYFFPKRAIRCKITIKPAGF